MERTYVQQQSTLAAKRFAGMAAGSAAGAIVLLWRGLGALADTDPIAVLAAVAAVVCGFLAKLRLDEWQKRSIGAHNEKRVAKVLERAKLGHVLHSVVLGAGGDADHVVIGTCLAVVETKTGHGDVRVEKDGMWAGKRHLPGDPVKQAARQANALAKIAQAWVTPVVCVTDMANKPFRAGDVVVCSAADLPSVLRQVGGAVDPAHAARILSALTPAGPRM